MLTLIPDVQITRRKRTHLVVDENGDTQFAATKLTDVLNWAIENEHSTLNIERDDQPTLILHFMTLPLVFPPPTPAPEETA